MRHARVHAGPAGRAAVDGPEGHDTRAEPARPADAAVLRRHEGAAAVAAAGVPAGLAARAQLAAAADPHAGLLVDGLTGRVGHHRHGQLELQVTVGLWQPRRKLVPKRSH